MRLIDADAFTVFSYKGTEGYADCFDGGVLFTLERLDKAPTIDAEPIRHGHWVYDHWCEFKCSNCGCWSNSKPYRGHEKYCPNCGAKMEGA